MEPSKLKTHRLPTSVTLNPRRRRPSKFRPRRTALSPATIEYLGTSCETFGHKEKEIRFIVYDTWIVFIFKVHTQAKCFITNCAIGGLCSQESIVFIPKSWSTIIRYHTKTAINIAIKFVSAPKFPSILENLKLGSLLHRTGQQQEKSWVENRKRSYHRAPANKRMWSNVAKLMNNNGSSSVSIVLCFQHLNQLQIRYLGQRNYTDSLSNPIITELTSTTTWPARRVLFANML